MLRTSAGVLALSCISLIGCSGDSGNPLQSSVGGNLSAGGNTATTNGGSAVGGSAVGGSAVGNGGAATGVGGQNLSQGGVVGQGGVATLTGGQAAMGGNATGGRATGGIANGGASSGGATTGGKATTGGAVSAGGAATGGKATGGAVSVGGAVTGGKAATGGAMSAGGAATGGKATGGAAAAVGGAATGGASSNGTTPIKVWIAGDSTVQNCSSACPCGWGSQFDALFNTNVTVVNSAVGGRSIQTWLYEGNVSSTLTNGDCVLTSTAYNARWSAMTNASTGMKAGDYLLIDFGINDGDSTCPRHVSTTLYKTYLGMMAQAAKAVGAFPIFFTATNAITCSGSTVPANRGFIAETKAAGTTYTVPVIDLNALTIALYTKLGFCPNNGDYTSGALGAFFCADHTHFEAAGAAQVAAVIAQALKDQKIGLAAYLL